jgi:hypothetical protein
MLRSCSPLQAARARRRHRCVSLSIWVSWFCLVFFFWLARYLFDGIQRRGGRRAAEATARGAVFLCGSLVLCDVLGRFLGLFPMIPLLYCENLVGLLLKGVILCAPPVTVLCSYGWIDSFPLLPCAVFYLSFSFVWGCSLPGCNLVGLLLKGVILCAAPVTVLCSYGWIDSFPLLPCAVFSLSFSFVWGCSLPGCCYLGLWLTLVYMYLFLEKQLHLRSTGWRSRTDSSQALSHCGRSGSTRNPRSCSSRLHLSCVWWVHLSSPLSINHLECAECDGSFYCW